jgi:hypothetical protein
LMGGQALRFVHQWLLTENELMVWFSVSSLIARGSTV